MALRQEYVHHYKNNTSVRIKSYVHVLSLWLFVQKQTHEVKRGMTAAFYLIYFLLLHIYAA